MLLQLERVANGDFEKGTNGWYVDGAVKAVTDADSSRGLVLRLGGPAAYAGQVISFLPETTYLLSSICSRCGAR